MAGAPKGNRNAKKAKDWENALRRILAQYTSETVPQGQALSAIAEVCVMQALAGDKDARNEIANRLDGKPKEFIEAEFTQRLAFELSEVELEHIAAGGSAGATETAQGKTDDSSFH